MNEDVINQYAQENPRRNVAVVGLRDAEGNVLLMRTHKLPDLWQPVGGGIDPDDASPAHAAVRELEEEYGLRVDPKTLTQVLTTPYDFGEGTVYFFEARINRNKLDMRVDTEEVVEYRWFSQHELGDLPAMPATQKYLQLLAK